MYVRGRAAVAVMFGALVTLAASRPASAQCDKQHTHRPVEDLFASDVVYLQEQGETQFEVKPARSREREVRTTTLEADVEYGLRDWWQLETEWDAREWTRAADGTLTADVGDIAIGTRLGWRCIGGTPYHLSVGTDVSMPSALFAEAGEVARHVDLSSSLIVARDVGRTAHVFSAIQLDARMNHRRGGVADWTYASDTGMFLRLVRGFRLTLELPVEGGPDAERAVHVIPGVLWHWGDTLEVGVGVLRPMGHETTRGVLAHAVCELGGRHDAR